jgi:hypothetical protein
MRRRVRICRSSSPLREPGAPWSRSRSSTTSPLPNCSAGYVAPGCPRSNGVGPPFNQASNLQRSRNYTLGANILPSGRYGSKAAARTNGPARELRGAMVPLPRGSWRHPCEPTCDCHKPCLKAVEQSLGAWTFPPKMRNCTINDTADPGGRAGHTIESGPYQAGDPHGC